MSELQTEPRPRRATEGAGKTFAGVEDSLPSAAAEHTPTCRRCGHPLTAEASVRRLLGPVCARHEVERVAAALRGAS